VGFVSPVTVINLEAAVDEHWSAQATRLKLIKEQMHRSGPLSLLAFINLEASDHKYWSAQVAPLKLNEKQMCRSGSIADVSGLQVVKIILIGRIGYMYH